jgi:hypothetical protein
MSAGHQLVQLSRRAVFNFATLLLPRVTSACGGPDGVTRITLLGWQGMDQVRGYILYKDAFSAWI